ncbi:toprim domain-containing protein [Epilithonimonas zeae]|uniref:Toprim-like n=1 Tax=Epilithonimonas zeae TaxID=1416779 RepID=A0A1N6GP64_9FLAO|nr:toprim domain-containing protein [Epilithonimonas zeae]SIO09308.1 Toprim-like [Epilithonimonas zeae]
MNCDEIKNRVGIRAVLESFNLFPVKDNPRSAFYFAVDRLERTASLSVNFVKNVAFDFGTRKSYDIISIVQTVKKCNVSEALKYLSALDNSVNVDQNNSFSDICKKYQITNVSDIKHPSLVKYLKSRKVYEQKHLVKELHYTFSHKKYFGIGFKNNSGGFEIRNQYSKICLGSKDVTTIISQSTSYNEILVFEGFFDFLSFKAIGYEISDVDFLILNSTSMYFKAERKLLDYKKISLFLDNDTNGIALKSKFQQQFDNVEDCSMLYRDFNDLNEWLCNYR